MFEQLKNEISNCVSLSDNEWGKVISYFTLIKVMRKTQLVKLDKIATELYFINKGAIRNYYLYDVEDLNVAFTFENSFITSLSSFLLQTPSKQVVEAMEDCELLVLNKINYQKLNRDIINFNVLSRIIVEQAMLKNEEQNSSLTFDTAEERYMKAREKQPLLFTRTPKQYLASYLDIPLLYLTKMIENK